MLCSCSSHTPYLGRDGNKPTCIGDLPLSILGSSEAHGALDGVLNKALVDRQAIQQEVKSLRDITDGWEAFITRDG